MNLIFLVFWNICIFLLYGFDKYRAMSGNYRVSEAMLITIAFSMGAVGSLMGMLIFRHKLNKFGFCGMILLALIVNIIILIADVKGIQIGSFSLKF